MTLHPTTPTSIHLFPYLRTKLAFPRPVLYDEHLQSVTNPEPKILHTFVSLHAGDSIAISTAGSSVTQPGYQLHKKRFSSRETSMPSDRTAIRPSHLFSIHTSSNSPPAPKSNLGSFGTITDKAGNILILFLSMLNSLRCSLQ